MLIERDEMKEIPKEWIEDGISYVSHNQLEKPACLRMFEYRFLKDERRDIPFGVPADAGGAAHDAIQSVICDDADIEDAIVTAVNRVQSHEPIDELDGLKTAAYVDDIEFVIRNGVEEISKLDDTFTAEEQINVQMPQTALPFLGFVDLTGEKRLVEIKTKWNTFNPPKKDGTRTPRQAKLPEQPDASHIRQVSIYWAATGKLPTLVYITTQGAVTFSQDNCDLLSVESLEHHFNQIMHNAIVWENLLSISTDPNVLKYYIQPNWDDFRWRFMPQEYLQQAKELFKL
jgi:hypothetical protein